MLLMLFDMVDPFEPLALCYALIIHHKSECIALQRPSGGKCVTPLLTKKEVVLVCHYQQ